MDTETHAMELPDGRTLAFAAYGDPDGVPVLWLHGTPGSRVTGRLYDAVARANNVRLLAVDRPGYGLSDRHRHTFTSFPQDLARLVDALGVDRFVVAGASGGGGWVLGTAWCLPDRVAAAGLIACMGPTSTPADTAGLAPGNRRRFQIARHAPPVLFAYDGWRSWASRQAGPVGRWFNSSIGKDMPAVDREALAVPEVGDVARAVYREGLKHGGSAPTWDFVLYARDWGFRLEDLKMPVHVWHGGLDVNVPVTIARDTAARLADGRLTVYEDQGHLITATRQHDIFATLGAAMQ